MSDDPTRYPPPPDDFDKPLNFDPAFDDEIMSGDNDADMYEPPDAIYSDDEVATAPGEALLSSTLIRWLALAAVLIIAIFLILKGCGPQESTPSPATQPTTTVTSAPGLETQPTFTPTAAVVATAVPEPAATPEPLPAPAVSFQEGDAVSVGDTGGAGMRLRTGPGLNYITAEILPDGVRLTVVGGPEEADGITWWRLETEEGNVGWGAQDVLGAAAE